MRAQGAETSAISIYCASAIGAGKGIWREKFRFLGHFPGRDEAPRRAYHFRGQPGFPSAAANPATTGCGEKL
jgi:hypothetical protein